MQRPNFAARSDSPSPAQIATGNGIDIGRELTKGFAAGLIREKAKQIARRAGFSKSDVDDLQQQFIGHVLENLAAFDPAQGHFNVFVKTLVERYTANILRDARAAKRDRRETCSLSMIVDEDEYGPVELSETIGWHELDSRLGTATREPHDSADLTLDVAEVLSHLPDELRELCERLKYATVSEISRDVGVPRTTIYERIKALRKRLAKAGLRDYL